MSERLEFLARLNQGESMSELCKEYGISRKTGYKFKKRFEEMGLDGLKDQSRAPHARPGRTPEAVRELLIAARKARPTWGPRKLRVVLMREHPGVRLPALSTIWSILKAEGLVEPRKRRRRTPPHKAPLGHARAPNDVWCVDFKGQFRLGNGRYCFPLTVTDAFSRYILACEALESTKGGPARLVFHELFRRVGLPKAIRSDNGSPFASTGLAGLSRLSAWWTYLGVDHERIRPGHPEENGRHERMHRTLKRDTTRPASNNLLAQQERFDAFVAEFNHVRPHEALDDGTPAEVYQPPNRPILDEEPSYPLHDLVVRVTAGGHIAPPRATGLTQVYLGLAFRGLLVGLRELDDGTWLVSIVDLALGRVQRGQTTLMDPTPTPNEVSPMSPS